MARPATIKPRILKSIRQRKNPVLLTRDFNNLGSKRQVLRVLRDLEDENVIACIGRGVYARLAASRFTDQPILEEPLTMLGRRYLDRIGAQVRLTPEERAYMDRRSTQVPTGAVIGTDRRIAKRLTYKNNRGVQFEKVS